MAHLTLPTMVFETAGAKFRPDRTLASMTLGSSLGEQSHISKCSGVLYWTGNFRDPIRIETESIKTTSMEDVSTRVLEKIRNI